MKKLQLPFFMLLPFVILISLFFIGPVILIFILSLTNMNASMQWNFTGFSNFAKMFTDPNMQTILINTVIYVFFTLLINVFFGLFLALYSTYIVKNETASLLFRTIWMLPRISPPVVYSLIWVWFFDPSKYGILNSIRSIFNLAPVDYMSTIPLAIVIIANGIVGASFGMIIFSSAITAIPKDLFKAAQIDGASHFSIIKDIILPILKGPIGFVSLWQLLSLLTSYEYILLITNGGPEQKSKVLSLFSYHKAFQNFEYGYGAALSLVLVFIAIVLTIVVWKYSGMDDTDKVSKID